MVKGRGVKVISLSRDNITRRVVGPFPRVSLPFTNLETNKLFSKGKSRKYLYLHLTDCQMTINSENPNLKDGNNNHDNTP